MMPEDDETHNEDVSDRLKLIVVRLSAITARCEEERTRYELREVIAQLVQIINGLTDQPV
jgi:hypothetical protein